MSGIVSGKLACEISAAGLGMMVGALASGASGGTLTAPAMIAGGAFGYLLGKAVCKIPALEKAFERALGSDDWKAFDAVMHDSSVRAQAIALMADEVGVPASKGEQIWDALLYVVRKDRKSIVATREYKAARHHPVTGRAQHGVADLQRKNHGMT